MITSNNLVRAIDNYIELYEEKNRLGQFWRKMTVSGSPSKQPVGVHTLALFPKEVATSLCIENPERYTGHCWRRTGGIILADKGASVLDLQRDGGWGSAGVAETYVSESRAQKQKVASKFDFDNKETFLDSSSQLFSIQSNTHQQKNKEPSLFANCSIVFNSCTINFEREKMSE
jgi:hypothetical protein